MITVESVTVLHVPVGNLWDVFKDNRRIGRVTYHGNTLVEIKRDRFGNPWKETSKIAVANAIVAYYTKDTGYPELKEYFDLIAKRKKGD